MGQNWLKRQRKALGLSQDDVAERITNAGLRVTRSTVSHWEVGRYNIPLNDAGAREAIAIALNMTVPRMLLEADISLDEHFSKVVQEKAVSLTEAALGVTSVQIGILENHFHADVGTEYQDAVKTLSSYITFILATKHPTGLCGTQIRQFLKCLAEISGSWWDERPELLLTAAMAIYDGQRETR